MSTNTNKFKPYFLLFLIPIITSQLHITSFLLENEITSSPNTTLPSNDSTPSSLPPPQIPHHTPPSPPLKYITIDIPYEDNLKYYITALGIGTPSTYFPVQIDITKAYTWIPSSSCTTCKSLSKYNSSLSNTSQTTLYADPLINQTNNFVLNGEFIVDTITINGDTVIPNYTFIQALNLTNERSNVYEDGTLGLGFPSNDAYPYSTLLESMKVNGIITNKVFSIKELNSTYGQLTFGIAHYNNVTRYPTCDVVINNKTHLPHLTAYTHSWKCNISHIAFITSNTSMHNNAFKNKTITLNAQSIVVFDVVSPYIKAPKAMKDVFKEKIFMNFTAFCNEIITSKSGDIVVQCDSNDNNMNKIHMFCKDKYLSFIVNGYRMDIPLCSLFEEIKEGVSEFRVKFKGEEEGDVWSLGYPFMRRYTVEFNEEDKTVMLIGQHSVVENEVVSVWVNMWDKVKMKWKEFVEEKKWFYYAVIAFGIVLGLVVLFLVYRCIRRCMVGKGDEGEKVGLMKNEV